MNQSDQSVAVPNAWTLPIRKEENVIGAIQAMKMPGLAEEVHHGVKDEAVGDLIHVADEVFTHIFVQLHVEAGGVKGHVEPICRIRIAGLAVVAKILVQQHFGTPLPLQAFKGATVEAFGKIIYEETLTQADFFDVLLILGGSSSSKFAG